MIDVVVCITRLINAGRRERNLRKVIVGSTNRTRRIGGGGRFIRHCRRAKPVLTDQTEVFHIVAAD